MSIRYVVIAAIPDARVIDAEKMAKLICDHCGGIFDWEFYDSCRVIYRFSTLVTAQAFEGHCAIMDWKIRK